MTDLALKDAQEPVSVLEKELQEISIKLEDLISRVDQQEDELNSLQETLHQGGYGYYGAASPEEYNDPDDVPPPLFHQEEPSYQAEGDLQLPAQDGAEGEDSAATATILPVASTVVETEEEAELELSEEEQRRQKVMSFLDHLEDLRWVIFKSVLIIALCVGLSLVFSNLIYELFMHPLKTYSENGQVLLRYKSPLSAFMIFMKMGLTGGLVLGFPFIVYFIWGFVSPGLRDKERRAVFWALVAGCLFFLVGGFLGYLFIPMGLPFLLAFAQKGVSNDWDIETYMSFCTNLVIAFGAMFEMPVLLALLIKIEVVSSEMLRKHRAMAVVMMFVIAAMITPPDVYSQIAVASPMVVFYEMGIIYAKRREQKKLKDAGAEEV